jgi:multiple sugar transport system permease protein
VKREGRRTIVGLSFTSPYLLGLAALTFYPVAASFYYSLCRYGVFSPPEFLGAANYTEMFARDPRLMTSFWNTFVYTIFAVPLGMVVALVLALLLNLKVRGQAFYRTFFFLPAIVPIVASSVLWIWVLNPQFGLINTVLRSLNVPEAWIPNWLASPKWSKPALILMSTWGAGHTMILYLAALQEVPRELYEAAEIDGAGSWGRIVHVTLPMISPILFFTLVMGLIGSFQYFTQAWIMTSGGPADSTLFYSLYLFNQAFLNFRMGYASAMAWVLFLIILVATALVFRAAARRVHYEGA